MLQTVVNGCFSFRNVKVYKIIKIFCFFLWWLQNMLYICTQITTTKLLSLKNRNYDNSNILHLEHKN